MTGSPTLRSRAEEGGRKSLCSRDSTDGFCRGVADCPRCGRLGAAIGLDVLRHVRPTLLRLMSERGVDSSARAEVLAIIDEATN